jgi:preprotein translocase subunit SecD
MLSSIRNRLILVVILVAASALALVPRDVTIRVRDEEGRMRDTTVKRVPIKQGLDLQGGIHLALEIDQSGGPVADPSGALDRALTVVRSRVDEFGVAEPLIQRIGSDRIVVELAGITEPGRAKQIVQRSAHLEWRITDMENLFRDALPTIDAALLRAGVRVAPGAGGAATPTALDQLLGGDTAQAADTASAIAAADTALAGQAGPLSTLLFNGTIPGEFLVPEEDFLLADSLLHMQEAQRVMPRGRELIWASEPTSQGARSFRPLYSVHTRTVLGGEELADARATIDPTSNQAIVLFELTRSGGRKFRNETRQHVGDYMAIMLDGRVFRQPPVIRSEIGRSGQIELGNASLQDAQDLALVLRAGALPAPLVIVEERAVGPSLGRDSIRQGQRAAMMAGILIVVVMLLYYRVAGFLAVTALLFYVLFTLGGLATMTATLTLPGLAGFILSLGMAVDANVLIFERIREELKLGKSARVAVDQGFEHAMPAIIDANVTTVITAAFLFQFGTGPVRGFAVTLIVGIIASLITAVFVTKTLFLIRLQRREAAQELSI